MGIVIIVGVVAGVIVAAGTIATGLRLIVNWVYGRGRNAEREAADRDRMKADLEDLKKRLPRQ